MKLSICQKVILNLEKCFSRVFYLPPQPPLHDGGRLQAQLPGELARAGYHSPYDAPEPYFTRYDRSELLSPTVGEWASIHDVAQDAVRPDAWRGKRGAQEMQYLCDGRMKYIWFPQLDSEQLFDLEADPGETRELAREPARQAEVAR